MTESTSGGLSRRTVLGGLAAGVGAAALAGFAAGCTAEDGKTAGTPPLSDTDIIDTLKLAFRWGYPLMAMALNNTNTYSSTMNAFYNMKSAADAKSQRDRGFNADTLYSAGALDLSQGPLVFTLPAVGDRYVIFPVQDGWGNIDNVIGTRTVGNDGGHFLISGPGWNGDVPAGMKHYPVHTNVAFLPGRTCVSSPEDATQFAATIQNEYALTPLSRWGSGAPNPNRDSLTDPLPNDPSKNYNTVLMTLPITDYFNQLNALLVDNPPYDYDQPVLDRFAPLGIGAGKSFDITKFSPTVQDAMKDFPATDVAATQKAFAEKGQDPALAQISGRFGTHYDERYAAVFGGLGGNLLDDAAYFWLTKDTDGAKLNGENRYVIRFAADEIPKVRAFWSLTLYNQDFYLPQDLAVERHVVNNNSGMRTADDGSLEIYLQGPNPGPARESNWLPTPPSGEYFMILRTYGPEGDILTGKYAPPPVVKVQ